MPILPHHSPFARRTYAPFPLAYARIPHPLVVSCSLGDRVLEGIGTGVEQEGSRKGRVLRKVAGGIRRRSDGDGDGNMNGSEGWVDG
jgi:hypothetical protein